MTDTAESVRNLAAWVVSNDQPEVYAMLHRYADLLERIEKAPVVLLFDDGQIMGPMGKWKMADVESLGGKRVALLQVGD